MAWSPIAQPISRPHIDFKQYFGPGGCNAYAKPEMYR
jgi:hypothetical protein